jgi:broad specificity phosphatase PhoE
MTELRITYFVHGTSADNEQNLSSGWHDVGLSELGKKQSLELRKLLREREFDVVYCSDLKRAVDSAEIVFGSKTEIIQDKRLRECNYGDLTRSKIDEITSLMLEHIEKQFPRGESCKDVEKRVKDLLEDLIKKYAGKNIAMVAHRAPQIALDVLLKGKTWEEVLKDDWRLKNPPDWRPGWEYKLIVEA